MERLDTIIKSAAVKTAFAAVDRKDYCGGLGGKQDVYSDQPFRATPASGCLVHLSAPSIYATSLEALELHPGLSFLNIGSGTGYFSAIVARLIGRHAPHHAIELRASLVEMARSLAAQDGFFGGAGRGRAGGSAGGGGAGGDSGAGGGGGGPTFHHGSVHEINVQASMAFDRVYVGAGASLEERNFVLSLLRIGGARAPYLVTCPLLGGPLLGCPLLACPVLVGYSGALVPAAAPVLTHLHQLPPVSPC